MRSIHGWQRWTALLLVLVLAGGLAGPGVDGGRSAGTRLPGHGPGQRWGTAAGLSHVEGEGRGNTAQPQSLQSKYPPIAGQPDPPPAGNEARVLDASIQSTAVRGFDAATSRELPDKRGRTQRTFVNADGTQTTEFGQEPMNFQRPDGSWQPIDNSLVPQDKGWRNAADSVTRWLAPAANADRIARLELDAQHRLEFGVDGVRAAGGQVSGSSVTYPEVFPGADLTLEVTTGGLKESILLHSADAPQSWLFPLRLTGLTASVVDGAVELRDEGGEVRARIPRGFMADSKVDERTGEGATSHGVTYALVDVKGQPALRMDLDTAWLRDPARVFPVTVDPPVDLRDASSSMYLQQSVNWQTGPVAHFKGTDELRVGHAVDNARINEAWAASFIQFAGVESDLRSHRILGVNLGLTNFSAASCNARAISVRPIREAWSPAGDWSWNHMPSTDNSLSDVSPSFAHGYIASGTTSSACPTATETINLGPNGVNLVQRWVDGTQPNYGLSIGADSVDPITWKKFTGAGSANPPRLAVTHSPYNATYQWESAVPNPPVTRTQGGRVKLRATNLSTQAWDSGYSLAFRFFDSVGNFVNWAVAAPVQGTVARGSSVTFDALIPPTPPGTYRYEFSMIRGGVWFTDEQVPPAVMLLTVVDIPPVIRAQYPPNGYSAPTLTPSLWAQGVDIDGPPNSLQYRFELCESAQTTCPSTPRQLSPVWTVPYGRLQWGKSYKWRVFAWDGTTESTALPFSTLLTAVPQPEITAHLGNAPYGGSAGEFDPLVGNYTTSAIDAGVSTVGPRLTVARTYNSLDPRRDTAFGLGWSSPFDMRAVADNDGSGNVLVTYQDGQQVRFGANLNASGQYDGQQLVSPPGRFAIMVPFIPGQANSGWSLADKSGTVYTFRPDGKLVEIRDSSGRKLALTYGTDGKLATATNQTSNRTLRFTWTGSHVTKVDTDPVNGAPLSWAYSYNGDRLTQVCDPAGGCTRYDSAPGTHYRSAVIDSRPDSYWRLDEPAGTTDAASQITLNLGADKARYSNVTLGAPGALPGTDDPAATFNGTTSAVVLPDGLVRKSLELTIELWFKTAGAGPLLGMQDKPLGAPPTTAIPVLYVGDDGKLRGQLRTGQVNPITTAGAVNDNRWHHVVLSSSVTTQTLYLDGTAVGSRSGVIDNSAFTHAQVGTAYNVPAGAWPQFGSASPRTFAGDIDEVAVYQHPLGPAAVQLHFAAGAGTDYLARTTLPSGKVAAQITYDTVRDRMSQYIDRNGGMWTLDAPVTSGGPTNILRMVRVLDPGNRAHFYEYDPLRGRILRYMAPLGVETRPEDRPPPPPPPPGGSFPPVDFQGARTYDYDANGFQSTIFDENGGLITLANDARGNITSRTTCRTSTTDCQTAYFEYVTGVSDPRQDKLAAARDARSSGPTDNRFKTSYTYTTSGLLETQTTPDSAVVRHSYTTGSTPAFDGGNAPAGLVATTTDPRGAITQYVYYRTGDLAELRSPAGLITRYTYDALGRPTGSTQISDSYPQGITTASSYDLLGHLVSMTGPGITNPVTGATHTGRNTATYDADGNPTRIEESDLTGGDPTRTTLLRYDSHNRVERTTDPEGAETSYAYDPFGNRTRMVNPAGVQFEFAYTARNALAEVRLRGWNSDPDSPSEPDPNSYQVLASYAYDFAGQLVRTTDAMGRSTRYRYYLDGLPRQVIALGFHNPDGTQRDLRLADLTYDAAGNLTRTTRSGGLVTTLEYDAVGRRTASTLDPTGLARRTALTYDKVGNVTRVAMTGQESNTGTPGDAAAEVVDYGYDASGRQTSQTVHTGTEDLTSLWGYDQRGLVTSITDPRGTVTGADPAAFTTNVGYDQLGRPVTTTAPPVSVETVGAQPVVRRPSTTTGYDTFGNVTEFTDANRQTSRSGYDKTGRLTSSTSPNYSPPGASQPITATTRLQYDQQGRLVELTGPRGAVTRYSYDQLSRLVQSTDPNPDSPADPGGVWRYTYTRTGDPLSVTDPTGARVEATYDDLGRQITASVLERQPQPGTFTTTFRYDDASNLTGVVAPSNATAGYTYDLVGQLTRLTSPSNVVTQLGYDRAGRQIKSADAAGRAQRTAFDLAGRATTTSDLAPDGTLVRQSKQTYDRAGNLATATDPQNHVSRVTVDALDRPTQLVRPVSPTESITTSYGYDADGNPTRYTDGRGNTTNYTVNTWGLPESLIEPATAAHPNLDARTWTAGYDAGGNQVSSTAPGGIRRDATYDGLDQLRQITGSGGETQTTTKTFGYDQVGRLTTSSAPGGTNTFSYNDRSELLTTRGPSGDSSFGYDGDGNLTTRTDAAGTATYGYASGRLTTMRDGVTGTQQTLGYNTSGQLSTVDYGGGRVRTFGYDNLARLTSDTLATNNTTTASITYGYDLSNWLTSKTTQGMAGAGSNTYGYDHAGRLTSWTKDGSTTTYGWDKANNRTQAAGKTATFDERNRLTNDGTSGYSYTARGTMATKTTGATTETFGFDAFDRLAGQGLTRYNYDALDRVVTRNGQRFAYTGASNELASDGTTRFGRGPFDDVLALSSGTANRLAIADQHGDVIGGFDPAATTTALADSVSFDPFGTPTASTGARRPIGFQGDYTDPDTGNINMTARWYSPSSGAFVSRDTVDPTNRYTYTYGSPLNYTDPSGHIGCDYHCVCGLRPDLCQHGQLIPGTPLPPLPPPNPGGGGGSGDCGGALDFGPDSSCCGASRPPDGGLDFAPSPSGSGCGATGQIGSGLGAGPGINLPGMSHAGGVIITPPAALPQPPPPPDPAIAAREANRELARSNPLPIPQAMLQPTYGGSSAPPVSSAPDVPSQAASDFRNDVNDINQSYSELANSLTVPNETVLGSVKSNTTAPTELAPVGGGCPPAVAPGCPMGLALGEAARQALGFFKGIGAVALETAKGLLGMAGDMLDCLNPLKWGKCGEHLRSAYEFGKALVTDPIGTVSAIGQAMIQPMIDAWNRGDYGEAIGRGFAELAETIAGSKGISKLKDLRGAKGAEEAAKDGDKVGGACSFSGATLVIMADGTAKPISDVQVGDQILAADPETGEQGPRTVAAVHVHEDKVVDLVTVGGEKVTTTGNHPFWDATDQRWERADQLDPGDDLLTTTGEHIRVVGLRSGADYVTAAYNLTVDDLHTFYVRAQSPTAAHDVLVHNMCPPGPGDLPPEVIAGRNAYRAAVAGLQGMEDAMRLAGKSEEEIARALHAERRAIGVKYKDLTPEELREEIYQRNIGKYGDPLGPSIDWLRAQGKSWSDIIESAKRTGGKDLGF